MIGVYGIVVMRVGSRSDCCGAEDVPVYAYEFLVFAALAGFRQTWNDDSSENRRIKALTVLFCRCGIKTQVRRS